MIPDGQKLQAKVWQMTDFMLKTDTVSMPTYGFTQALLGHITDPRLGKSEAGFALEVLPLAFGYDFEVGYDSITYDSVFITLNFSGKYGSDKTPMEVEVYELKEALPDSTNFHAASNLTPGSNYIDKFVDYDNPIQVGTNPITLDSTSIRVRLNDAFRDKLYTLANPDTTEDDYKSSLYGFYIRVKSDNGGGIVYSSFVYDPSDYYTAAVPFMWAYYHYSYENDSSQVRDSIGVFPYYTSVYEKRMNVFRHDYQALSNSSDILYLQGMCGVVTKFTIDTSIVKEWTKRNGHLAINRAQLIFPVADPTDWRELDKYPTQLRFFSNVDSMSYERDMQLVSSSYDGNLDRSHMYYSLNVTHFFNDVMNKKRSGMYLAPYSTTSSANSAFLTNFSGVPKPRLIITYEEIKDK